MELEHFSVLIIRVIYCSVYLRRPKNYSSIGACVDINDTYVMSYSVLNMLEYIHLSDVTILNPMD